MPNNYGSNNVVSLSEHRKEIELVKAEFKDLYDDLIATGKSESDTFMIVRHIESQQDNYFHNVQYEVFQIRKHFTLVWLEDHFQWSKTNNKQRKTILWDLGMDVKKGKRWYQQDERVRNEDGKDGNTARIQAVIYGQERLDDEWVNMRYDDFSKVASEEAQDWRRRKSGGILRVKK
jgi:hypothetical protein